MIAQIDAYYQERLWMLGRTERVGPFTLFVGTDPEQHFAVAYPIPGALGFTVDEVHQALKRQRELGEPGTLAWVHDRAAGLADIARRAGMAAAGCPLLAWSHPHSPPLAGCRVRTLSAGDRRVARACALIAAATPGTPMTARGSQPGAALVEQVRARAAILVAALDTGGRPIAAAAHVPCGGLTELTAIGAVAPHDPAITAAVAAAITRDALARELAPFLPAHTAVPYQKIGYTRAGTWFTATVRTGPPLPRRDRPTAREAADRHSRAR